MKAVYERALSVNTETWFSTCRAAKYPSLSIRLQNRLSTPFFLTRKSSQLLILRHAILDNRLGETAWSGQNLSDNDKVKKLSFISDSMMFYKHPI